MTTVLLDSLVPIFAVMALGYFAGWVRDIGDTHLAELNALVMDFALPASLFIATASTPWMTVATLWPMLIVIIVAMLALYVLSFWMQRRLFGLSSSAASVQALTISLPNYGAAGLPLIAAVFNNMHAVYVALTLAAGSIVISPLTLAVLEANKSSGSSQSGFGLVLGAVGRSFLKPIVLAPVLGLAVTFFAVPLPDFIGRTFALIGQGAGGVAAFLTGLILSSQAVVLNSNVVSGTLLKNVAQPLLTVGLIILLPMPNDEARATVLLAALPSGFFGVLFGLRYGVESQLAGSTLIASSVLGAVSVAAVIVATWGGD
jgi:malonate transporter and related proteins